MELAVIGHGGHSKVIQDIIRCRNNDQIIAFLDDKYQERFHKAGVYYGGIASVPEIFESYPNCQIVIAIGDNGTRKNIVEKLQLPAERYATLIHPAAVVSPSAKVKHGTVVMANAVINADSRIGSHSIINTSAIIEHDSQVGDFVHVSTKAGLTGAVHLKEGVFIGAGATIIPKVQIGLWSVIGAGATVIDDLPDFCTAVGTPAKVKGKQIHGGA